MFTLQIIAVLLAFRNASATEPKSGYHVDQLDPAADVSSLKERHTVRTRDELNVKQQLPTREARETAFGGSGLTEEVQKMDELDRDVLYLTAKTKPLAAVQKKYPKIAKNHLAQLSALLRTKEKSE